MLAKENIGTNGDCGPMGGLFPERHCGAEGKKSKIDHTKKELRTGPCKTESIITNQLGRETLDLHHSQGWERAARFPWPLRRTLEYHPGG